MRLHVIVSDIVLCMGGFVLTEERPWSENESGRDPDLETTSSHPCLHLLQKISLHPTGAQMEPTVLSRRQLSHLESANVPLLPPRLQHLQILPPPLQLPHPMRRQTSNDLYLKPYLNAS